MTLEFPDTSAVHEILRPTTRQVLIEFLQVLLPLLCLSSEKHHYPPPTPSLSQTSQGAYLSPDERRFLYHRYYPLCLFTFKISFLHCLSTTGDGCHFKSRGDDALAFSRGLARDDFDRVSYGKG